jgi:hypothetical protein
MRGEMQRILSVFGAAASADATTTECDDDSVDECGRYDKSPTATVRFWQQQYHWQSTAAKSTRRRKEQRVGSNKYDRINC